MNSGVASFSRVCACYKLRPVEAPRRKCLTKVSRGRPLGCAGGQDTGVESTIYDIDRLIQKEMKFLRERGNGAIVDLTEGGIATGPIRPDEAALVVPGDLVVTRIDAENALGKEELEKVDDLTALALWMLHQRAVGPSTLSPLLESLWARAYLCPLTWPKVQLVDLLKGSYLYTLVEERLAAVESALDSLPLAPDMKDSVTMADWVHAFAAVLSGAQEVAGQLALIPVMHSIQKRPRQKANFDLKLTALGDTGAVSLVNKTSETLEAGGRICAPFSEGQTPAERAFNYGTVGTRGDELLDNFLLVDCSLLRSDSLYSAKKMILEDAGFPESIKFPTFEDRFPIQLLSFLRLARVQDSMLLSKVDLQDDKVISDMNEYEVLMLLLSDTKGKLGGFEDPTTDSDVKIMEALQKKGELTIGEKREMLAAQVNYAEKRVLMGTLAGIRKRLAPIRGIPTKSGKMEGQYSDIEEIFETFESLPKKIFSGQFIKDIFADDKK